MNCIACGNPTANPKFCSRSCATAYNNRAQSKRKRVNTCQECKTPIHRNRTYCRTCWQQKRIAQMNHTLSDTTLITEYGQRTYQRNARIRDWARRIYANSGRPYVCVNCGYDKHVEVCHIQAIKSFPEETPLNIVNSLENLVALCPNCHWEFDNGLLQANAIVKEHTL